MIVEFIGCAGAGKTTLRRIMCEDPSGGNQLVTMPDLLLDRALLRWITHPTAVNVVQEVGGLPFFLRASPRERDFLALANRMLMQNAPSMFHKLNGMRGIVRKVGMFEFARSRASDRIVLSDEGTLLTAYNLFVMTNVAFAISDLEHFARLVPLPDLVVHVRAPVASLVKRAASRPDPRRQHLGRNAREVERDIRRTLDVFDLVVTTAPLSGRVLVVDNDDGDWTGRRELAGEIARWVRASPYAPQRQGNRSWRLRPETRP